VRRPRGFTLLECLVVMAVLGVLLSSLATIVWQWRRAERAARARLDETERLGSAAATITEDVRRASAVLPASALNARIQHPGLVLRLSDGILLYAAGDDGLVRTRLSRDGAVEGRRVLLPPGTEAVFSFPGGGALRWVEISLRTPTDAKRQRPPYKLFVGLRGMP